MIEPRDKDFVEVVPANTFAAADEAFRKWLHDAGLQLSDLADEDIRIDTVRSLDGRSLRRYMVRPVYFT
jgi:hypothetical protein